MKYVLVILSLFIATCTYAQKNYSFKSYINIGYYDSRLTIYDMTDGLYHTTGTYLKNRLYTEVCLGFKWKRLSVNSNIVTIMKPSGIMSYLPLQTGYHIEGCYTINNTFELNIAHFCTHSTENFVYNEGYTKAGIKINLINK